MSVNRSLISPTSNPVLERALRDKLRQRSATVGDLGELESLAVRLGLMQNNLKPRFRAPQLVLFAADHGLAVEGIGAKSRGSTSHTVQCLLASRLPVTVFARLQGLELSVVDCGVAEALPTHARLVSRKIAHGTRNARVAAAMSLEQAHAAIRAGMEIADTLPGNVVACGGVGVASDESAALLLCRLAGANLSDLVGAERSASPEEWAQQQLVLHSALARHPDVSDPVEALAAMGGFDVAAMVGVMLVAASKRQLLIPDGMAALAALLVASRIAPAVTDYCVFTRSHGRYGLEHALALFQASALLELGMDSIDGTGATLAWPLIRSAAALLTEVAEGEDPGPTVPSGLRG